MILPCAVLFGLVSLSLAFTGTTRTSLISNRCFVQLKAAEKKITFTNYKEKKRMLEHEQVWIFTNENDFQIFLRSTHSDGVEDSAGVKHRQLATLDESTKYELSYSAEISENAASRFSNFIDNTSRSFEGKANLAVVRELVRLGHSNVHIMHSSKKVFDGVIEAGELDGVIATDSHFFVVESKLHAKDDDVFQLSNNIYKFKNPKYGLVSADDPRLLNGVIGIIATSSAPDVELKSAAREIGKHIWILAANGMELHLDDLKYGAVTAITAGKTPVLPPFL